MNFSYYYGTEISGGRRTIMVAEMKNGKGGLLVAKTTNTSRGGNGYKRTAIYGDKDAASLMSDEMVNVKVEQFRCLDSLKGFFLKDLQDCFGSIMYAVEHNPSVDCFMNQQLLSNMVRQDMDEALAAIGLAEQRKSLADSLSEALLESLVCTCVDADGLEDKLVAGAVYPAQRATADMVYVIGADGEEVGCARRRFRIATVRESMAKRPVTA